MTLSDTAAPSPTSTAPPRAGSHAYRVQWLILILALLALCGIAGHEIYKDHEAVEQSERDRLLTQARVIDDNLGRQLRATDQALQGILRDLPGWRTAAGWQAGLTKRMAALEEAMSGVRTLSLVDAEGTIRASNRPTLVGFDASAREYFRHARAHANADTLYVSPPFRTVLGVWSITVSRSVAGPRGEFAGLITATLDPEYFSTLMGSVQYAPDMWVAIAHGDGRQILMVPERQDQAGKDLAQPGSFFSRHRDSGRAENVLTGIVYATGEERVMALRTVKPAFLAMDKPLVVAVGRDLAATYEEWRRHVGVRVRLLLLAALGSAFALAFYQRGARRSDRRILEAQDSLRRSNERFELLLRSAGEGIYGVDLQGHTMFVNPAALAMLGFPQEEVLGRDQHLLFHHRRPDGSLYPHEDCAIFQTLGDGIRRDVEDHFIRKNGELFPVHLTVTPMEENGVRIGAEVVFQDIAERKAMERELIRLATTDALTDVANRRHFMAQLDAELARIKRLHSPASLLMLDIDHFKQVNDGFGHAVGDDVLRHFCAIATKRLRRVDLFGRLGGEEFGILLPGTDLAGAAELAETFRRQIADSPAPSRKGPVSITVSIGVTLLATTDCDADDALARADAALYQAKERGRNRIAASTAPSPDTD